MYNEIILTVAIVSGLGLLFGLGLALASKKFGVKIDERIQKVRDVLPGANCGGCGQSGCDGFAEGVVNGKCAINGCPVGGAEVAKKIGEIMGADAGSVEPKVARVMCSGTFDTCKSKFQYDGIQDCTAAASLHGGPSACSYGCVGMGSCAKACPFGAIVIEDGLARVIASKCTSCAKCVAACPKKIIEIAPVSSTYAVKCSSLDKGAVVRKNCSKGCIGCGKCTKVCPVGAIKLNGTLAEIDPAMCTNCGECMKACPTGAIDYYAVCPEDKAV